MPNQRDVAAKANVSSASVSRYLKDPSQLTPRMREKVKNAIDATGYKLDYFARILKTGRSQHIGILLPGNGPFYWEVLQGIQDSLMHSGYFTTTLYTRDIDPNLHNSQEMLTKLLNCNMLEGVIYFPLSSSEDVRIMGELQRFHKHIVIVDRDMGNFGFDQVYINNYDAGRKAAGFFLEKGHTRLIFLHGLENSYAAVMRRQGFTDRLHEAGIILEEERVVHGDYRSSTAYMQAKRRMAHLPEFTGVFAVSDSSAIGFLRAAREYGLDCPKDFSLIGFDNNEEFAPYVRPALATFQQPLHDMGRIASERLMARIDGDSSIERIVLDTEFLHRESLSSLK